MKKQRRGKFTYIPKDEIAEVTTFNDVTFENDDLLDGAYVKGRKKYARGGNMRAMPLDEQAAEAVGYDVWFSLPDMEKAELVEELVKSGTIVPTSSDTDARIMELIGQYEYADGGMMANGGYVTKGELVWRKLRPSQKIEFLYENFTPQITPRSQEKLVGKDFRFLPKDVKIKLQAKYANVDEYSDGGVVKEEMEKFVSLAKLSKDGKDFIDKSRKIQVNSATSDWFFSKYNDLDMYKSAQRFVDDVKSGVFNLKMADGGMFEAPIAKYVEVTIPMSDIKDFKKYVKEFYGKGEIYQEFFPKSGATKVEIDKAVNMYVDYASTKEDQWGGGDSFDREIVRDIMLYNRGSKKGLEFEKVVKKVVAHSKKEYGGMMADGGTVAYTNKFEEVLDGGMESYYIRKWGVVEDENNRKIELVAVANIKDLEEYVAADELPEDGNFNLSITLVPLPKFMSKDLLEEANDDSSSISDNTIVNVVNYMGGLNYSPETQQNFETLEDAVEYLHSKELNDRISSDAKMGGYVLDNRYSRMETNWERLSYMTETYVDSESYADGGMADVEQTLTENEYNKIVIKLDELYGRDVDESYIHIYDLWNAYSELSENDHESPFTREKDMVIALVNTFENHGWNVDMPHGRYNVKQGYMMADGGTAKLARGGFNVGRWYRDSSGEEFKYVGEDMKGNPLFNDGTRTMKKPYEDFSSAKEEKLFGWFADGGVATGGKFLVKYHLKETPNEIKEKLFDDKDKAEFFFDTIQDDDDVVVLPIEEVVEKVKVAAAPKTKNLFSAAKPVPVAKTAAKKRERVQVDGISDEIERYDALKAIINNAKAEQEIIGGRLKEIGREKFLDLYEDRGFRPANFDLADGNENILLEVTDKYLKVEPEKAAILEQYDGLLEVKTTYEFNPEILEKSVSDTMTVGDVVSMLIQDSKLLSDSDKENLIKAKTTMRVPKGTIDRLLDYDNPREVFNLISPILALK